MIRHFSFGLWRFFSSFGFKYSIASRSPISWLIDGPQTMYHNFSASFCEVKLSMTIYNSSDAVASLHVNTLDWSGNSSEATSDQSPATSSNDVGWHDVSLVTDSKVTSDVIGARFGKPPSFDSVSPFIWSASSSTRARIKPMSSVEIPLQICVFSPGTYDLSNYLLHWNLLLPNGEENLDAGTRQSSGTCRGYPYHLTVLQSVWSFLAIHIGFLLHFWNTNIKVSASFSSSVACKFLCVLYY